jgi:hypothetical protein
MKSMDRYRIAKKIFLVPLFIAGLFLFTWFVMLLWNAVLPAAIPAIKAVTYWQAMGILVLSKVLFGFGRGCGGYNRSKHRIAEKLKHMTPEEKEKFKSQVRKRWGGKWNEEEPGDEIPIA